MSSSGKVGSGKRAAATLLVIKMTGMSREMMAISLAYNQQDNKKKKIKK
jgi:hypothetical protein